MNKPTTEEIAAMDKAFWVKVDNADAVTVTFTRDENP